MAHLYYSTEKLYADYDFHLPERFNPDFDSFTLAPIGKPFKAEKTPSDRTEERKERRRREQIERAKEVMLSMLVYGSVPAADMIKALEREKINPKIGAAARKELGVSWRGKGRMKRWVLE